MTAVRALGVVVAGLSALGPVDASAEADVFGIGDGHHGSLSVQDAGVIVNSYVAPLADLPPGASSIPVPTTTGFASGDLVLVWQTASAVFTPDAGEAGPFDLEVAQIGQWELGRLQSTGGGLLALTAPLIRGFAAAGAQVVKVPEYGDVSISPGASVVPSPWNGATGGIVAFFAKGTVTNEGVIDASARGFRPGNTLVGDSCPTECDGLDYPPPCGGQKGEGLALSRYGPAHTGTGNVAHAGGGGVCSSAGGGGGGNAGRGGKGGYALAARDVGGRGGAPLSYSLLTRLVMGGGGGAPHGGGYDFTGGGTGGGAVFLRAGRLAGAGFVRANGNVGDTHGCYKCVGEGGGAGGAVFLQSAGVVSCGGTEANGGGGADVVDIWGQGPGGGGGGGQVLLQGTDLSTCPASVLAGVAGTTPTSGFGPHYGAEPSSGVQPGFVGRLEIIPVGFASDAGPPRIVSTAATSAECGVPYRYSEKGGPELSPDAGTFTFGAQGKGGAPLPEGFAIDTRTGEIRWVPSREQAGAHELEVWATHAAGSDVQRFSVTVSCPPQTETEVKCGCGHVGAGFSFLALTLVALTRRRWSR